MLLTPPPEFVAARNALAKQLRAEGRRDDAAAVAAVRRPSWNDWALNRAATTDAALAGDFAATADRMRHAQQAVVGGDDLDVAGALRSLRAAMAELAKAAGGELRSAGRSADAAGLAERLTEVAADSRLTAAVRTAVLIDDANLLDHVLGDVLGTDALAESAGTPDEPAVPPRQGRASPSHRPTARPGATSSGESGESGEPDVAAERAARRRDLQREVAALRDRRRDTERDLRRVERSLGEAEHARGLALAAVERAQADLAAADRRLGEVTDRRDALRRELDVTHVALERNEAAMTDIESSSESSRRAIKRRGQRP